MNGRADTDIQEHSLDNNRNVKFDIYGDIKVNRTARNLREAVDIYRELPSKLTYQNAVPIEVHLLPLSKLDSGGKRMVRKISTLLLDRIEERFDDYENLQSQISDLKIELAISNFTQMADHINDFEHYLKTHRVKFFGEILKILPKVSFYFNRICHCKAMKFFLTSSWLRNRRNRTDQGSRRI